MENKPNKSEKQNAKSNVVSQEEDQKQYRKTKRHNSTSSEEFKPVQSFRKVLQNAGYTGKKDQSADLISPINAKIVALFVLKTQLFLEHSSVKCYHINA